MNKPTSIKIFGQKYKIKFDQESGEDYGITDQSTNTIHVRPDLPEDKMLRVFMHEVTHAIIFETPMSTRKRFDVEEVCDIVGYHVLDTLRENPSILNWVMRELDEN